jgi:hypothetical protein
VVSDAKTAPAENTAKTKKNAQVQESKLSSGLRFHGEKFTELP